MRVKVIIDTNVWVSYFINGRINYLVKWLIENEVEIIISDYLLDEILEVLQRPKFKRKIVKEEITDFLLLIRNLGSHYETKPLFKKSPDAEDNFLFDLCIASSVNYLITSDKKLLEFDIDIPLEIISFPEFRKLFF